MVLEKKIISAFIQGRFVSAELELQPRGPFSIPWFIDHQNLLPTSTSQTWVDIQTLHVSPEQIKILSEVNVFKL